MTTATVMMQSAVSEKLRVVRKKEEEAEKVSLSLKVYRVWGWGKMRMARERSIYNVIEAWVHV